MKKFSGSRKWLRILYVARNIFFCFLICDMWAPIYLKGFYSLNSLSRPCWNYLVQCWGVCFGSVAMIINVARHLTLHFQLQKLCLIKRPNRKFFYFPSPWVSYLDSISKKIVFVFIEFDILCTPSSRNCQKIVFIQFWFLSAW